MSAEEETARATASTLRPPAADRDTAVAVASGPAPKAGLPRGTSLGRFIVIDPLGEGAMGEVFLAYDPDLHRRVAVKVLKAGLSAHGGAAVQRMLREARAMAKVSHPNVITVFEVDQMTWGRSFIAMEYVEGGTLRDWSREARDWRAVVEVYAAAGAGLAAAHAQGLVHRDFKPDNVLIGRDGRVRVTDFGLVGAVDDDVTTSDAAVLTSSSSGSRTEELGPTDATLIRTGSLLGTPAYMAPEEAKHLDARSDQFSFCVALYEALFGERPFAGDTLAELRSNVCDGRRRALPSETDVPRWLTEAVERGLALDPGDRWPDMPTLLRALQRDAGRTGRRVAYAVAALGVVGTALGFAIGGNEAAAPRCDRGEDDTATLWNPARANALREAFTRVDPDNAAAGFEAVRTAMDGFVAAWQAGHLDACEAHRIRGDQSGVMFDRRMLCLHRRLERTDALLEVFEDPDSASVGSATQIGGFMPSVDTCADVEALQSLVPPPDAPEVRKEWKRLQLAIDRADALSVAGRQIAALDLYADLRDPIDAVGHPPLSARYLQNYGNALIRVEKFAEAIEVLTDAPEAAARSDDPRIEANVWLLLARAHGF